VVKNVNAFVRGKSIVKHAHPARRKVEITQTHVHHVEQENILGPRKQAATLVEMQSIPRVQQTQTAQNVNQEKKGWAQVALAAN
jgi:hypothetical protein